MIDERERRLQHDDMRLRLADELKVQLEQQESEEGRHGIDTLEVLGCVDATGPHLTFHVIVRVHAPILRAVFVRYDSASASVQLVGEVLGQELTPEQ